ncbi:MAG: UPF0149 family protein [Halioglobus sp.]|nr:UPF0149 family protein [Halioglobus sp.]MDG2325216.1 UPF0149 family protein [Halioglobus sp.]
MFDPFGDEIEVFDIDELANHLLEQGLESSPSNLHGCLCGLLSAGAPAQAEAGLALMSQALEINLHGELAGQMLQLYQVTGAALEDEEFDFHPLLPDDDVEIDMRTIAVADWASGFLTGFAQVNQAQVGQDSSEILRDFAAIVEAAVDEDSSEEEAEGAYMEIVEYLRFATLNIFMDSRAESGDRDQPSVH